MGLLEIGLLTLSDTLNSPQGDGNRLKSLHAGGKVEFSQTPSIPRKGTETFWNASAFAAWDLLKSDTLNSPQGDGNLTPAVNGFCAG